MKLFVFMALFCFAASSFSSISPRIYNALNEIQEALSQEPNSEDLKELESELLDLSEGLKGNSTGLALTFQILAQVKDAQGDERAALKFIKSAYALPKLESTTKSQLAMSLGYLYYAQEQYQETIDLLESHIKSFDQELSGTHFALLAGAYFALEKYKEGLPHIEKACELSKSPKEQWLSNAFSANYRLGKYQKATKFINQLVYFFPEKEQYWQQKAALHQQLEQFDAAALVTELSHKQGYIKKETQFLNLGILLATYGAPFEVAVSIEDALENNKVESSERLLRLLSMAWIQAKEIERAKYVLKKLYKNYQQEKDGLQLLSYLIDDQNWDDAISVIQRLQAQDLSKKQKGRVWLMKGIAQYRLGDSRAAKVSLGKASAIKEVASQAKSWISYINQMQS